MTELAAKDLQALLTYAPETGKLFWKARPLDLFKSERDWKIWNTRYAGKEAFTARNAWQGGRRSGAIFGVNYTAHRVAWALHHGEWPTATVDHINGDPTDNRIANLRDVSCGENNKNQSRKKTNTSGRVGVHKASNADRWIARININGKHKHVGCFKNYEDACFARWIAEQFCGYHANHGRAPA